MTAYYGGNKIKDTGAYGVYLGSKNTNCLTYTPKNIDLELIYGAWTQPVLTADGTLGGNSFAVALSSTSNNQPAYKAFDGNADSSLRTGNSQPSWVTMYNPVPLKVTKIHYVQNEANFWATELDIQASKTGADNTWVTLKSLTGLARYGDYTWNINTNDVGYKYYRIYIKAASRTDTNVSYRPVQINTIELTATALNTLVLKKGSKVYVPNGKNTDGSNKFDEVVIGSDKTFGVYGGSYNDLFLCLKKDGNYFITRQAYMSSGTTTPTDIGNRNIWYDTNNNIVKTNTPGSSEFIEGLSLPIAIIGSNGKGYTSIDQTFDWCGYVGSTAFVLPVVKGLIPNGFNADGTYKSTEFETSKVLTVTSNTSFTGDTYLSISENYVDRLRTTTFSHNKKTNLIEYSGGNVSICFGGVLALNSDRITSLTPYTAQPAMTCIPINAIYNGSQKVYQYNSYQPSTVLVSQAGDNTSRTIKLRKGVYEIVVTGGGGFGKYGWYNAIFHGQGGSGSSIHGEIYVPEDTTITYYAGTDNQSSSSSAYGYSSYIAVNGTQILTAGGGQSGWDLGNNGAGGTTTNNISASKIQNISLTFKNGVAGGSGGTSVDPDGISGEGGKATGTASDRGNVGRVYIKYIRYNK